MLGRLAVVLGVPYLGLMQLAGYLDDEQRAEAQGRVGKEPHPLAGQVLSPAEWRAVGSFIDELKARRRATIQDSITRNNPRIGFETADLPGFFVIAKTATQIINAQILG